METQTWKRTLWILFGGVMLSSASYTMSVPFLPLYLLELGVGDDTVNLWAGVVHSSTFLIGAIMAPLWGSLADKYGKRKMVVRAGISLAIIYALVSIVQNPVQLLGVRLLHGLFSGFVPASMAIVASVAPREQLSWSLGIMQAGTMSGGIMGPLLGGLLATWFGQRMSFVVAAVIILLATLAVLIWVQEGKQAISEKPKESMWSELRVALHNRELLYLLGLLLLFQLAINMVNPLLTLHIADLQGGLEGAVLSSGFVFALVGLAGIVAAPMWGRTGEQRGFLPVLSLCLFAAGTAMTAQFFVHSLWVFVIVQTVFGFFMAGVSPLTNTLVLNHTSEAFRGRSFGLTTSANQFGSMIGPLLGGGIGYFLSMKWLFVSSGICLAMIGVVIVLYQLRHRQSATG